MTTHDWRRTVNQFSACHSGEVDSYEYACTVCGEQRYVAPADPLPPGPCPGRGQETMLCARHVAAVPATSYVYAAGMHLCAGHADAMLPRAEWESRPWEYWGDDTSRWPSRAGGEGG